ncbi:spermidine/putrescine ABC transporter membrane protein [Bremerella volcania]|uniref:Spermidine/putrescine ABC transporter membrane protein n=1 Tax=Bremerella volcania TaxID=2527984 RepID=A0A518C6X4_9BACT|nr:ABC transporter permease subunit [Bremerella volcania]QDU74952.1 spermidine/putrescine ABC transporter membrane protein [Bremerella volcania]
MTSHLTPARRPLLPAALFALTAAALAIALLIWGDPLSVRLTFATAIYALAVIAITLPPATATSLLLFRSNLIGRGVLVSLLTIWLFIPIYVHIAGWRDLFGPQGWLEIPSPFDTSANLIDGWTGLLWLHSLAAFPWAVLITGMAFTRSSAGLEDDARLEVTPLAVLAKVTLRQNWDAVLVAAAWIIVTVFGEMSIASVCNVRTYAEVVFTGIPLGQSTSQSTLTVAPGTVLIVGLILLTAWLAHGLRPAPTDVEVRQPKLLPLGHRRAIASLAVWLLFLIALAPPIVGLVYKVGITIDQVDGQFVRGWSLAKVFMLTLSSASIYRKELLWTLALSMCVAAVTTLISLLLSDLATRGRWGGRLVSLTCALLFALPGPIVGIGIAWGSNWPWLAPLAPLIDRSIFAPTLAILTVTVPLVTFFYWHTLNASRQLYEMARIDGSSWWRTWTRVVLPANIPAIVAGSLIALVLAANDVSASVMVLPAGIDTISRRIFGLLHFGGEDNVAGILLMNLGVVAVLSVAIRRLVSWRGPSDFGD